MGVRPFLKIEIQSVQPLTYRLTGMADGKEWVRYIPGDELPEWMSALAKELEAQRAVRELVNASKE